MMHAVLVSDGKTRDEYNRLIYTDLYERFKIVPTSRPVINPPAKKKKTLEIPGANGSLDISSALTGFPVFENRTGSIEFVVLNDFNLDNYRYDWQEIYHDVLDLVHGEMMFLKLEDEPGYYYKGGLTVNSWKSDKNNSTITIDYDLQPYRFADKMSSDAYWLWDPFNFERDYIGKGLFGNITVPDPDTGATTVERTFNSADIDWFGNAPLMPELEVIGDVTVTMEVDGKSVTKRFNTPTKTTYYKIYELTIYKADIVKYTISGTGKVSINFYKGYL